MREIDELLAAYLDGEELVGDELSQLKEWLSNDENQQFYSHITAIQAQGDLLRKQKHPQRDFIKIKTAIQKKRNRKRLWRYGAVAAGIAVLLTFSLWFFVQTDHQPEDDPHYSNTIAPGQPKAILRLHHGEMVLLDAETEKIVLSDSLSEIRSNNNTLEYTTNGSAGRGEYNVLTVPRGAEYKLLLSDGTKVYLNSGSELRYPIAFADGEREVYLSGEGYFEVTADTMRPFIIEAGLTKVRVLGTSFNINAYPERSNTFVTLEKGLVEVLFGEDSMKVLPGMQVVNDKESGMSCREVKTELYTSWKDGYYYFRGQTLEEIMSTLAVWYDMNVVFEDENARSIIIGGRLKRYDDINYLLEKFEQTNEIEYEIKGNVLTIRKK